jgi:hypothetical protein
MSAPEKSDSPDPPLSRDELVTLVARAHGASSAYAESSIAGRTLAAQSALPSVVAVNLGAGFGQWDFFPTPADVVDFALGYVAPRNEEDVWALARSWASDDAAGLPTVLALIGRDILQHELRRIEVPSLHELIAEVKPARARELRSTLGLPVPALAAAKPERKKARAEASPPRAAGAAAPVPVRKEIPTRMPKPEFKAPPKPPPPAAARRFEHPKFGVGVLAAQDGVGPDAKLTIAFDAGPKTLLAKYVNELPSQES